MAPASARSITIAQNKPVEIPKPLELLSESEIQRKQIVSKITTFTLKYLTSEFLKSGFEWLLPVIFSKSTDPLWPDPGASIEKRVEVEIYGKTVRATQSMIVHKMVACSLVQPKLFTLSPNVRIEKMERANSGLHVYEFTQLDFEIRNASSREVRSFVEKMISGLVRNVKNNLSFELSFLNRNHSLKIPEAPFKVYDREELENEYGRNWETQLTLEIVNPVWITNIPREFYDFEDFEKGMWDNYDLLLPKYGEVLSGSKREWEYHKLVRKMERDNIKQENFALLLSLSKQGKLKPSAGAGIGIERLVSWITGAKHVGETQMFPKIPGLVYDL
ncbi:MAG: asparagine synthetase A [Candidatus Bathyarchaeota archaeon]|jgi:asparaginyl-tRNA synthetase|nr:asparagine synthetase [Candidatus Bathyarchaeota archaeon A05DMB-5]MDH7557094.1 asparagine synthetase A [Candidatus Bathyarchaeota archaeon]